MTQQREAYTYLGIWKFYQEKQAKELKVDEGWRTELHHMVRPFLFMEDLYKLLPKDELQS